MVGLQPHILDFSNEDINGDYQISFLRAAIEQGNLGALKIFTTDYAAHREMLEMEDDSRANEAFNILVERKLSCDHGQLNMTEENANQFYDILRNLLNIYQNPEEINSQLREPLTLSQRRFELSRRFYGDYDNNDAQRRYYKKLLEMSTLEFQQHGAEGNTPVNSDREESIKEEEIDSDEEFYIRFPSEPTQPPLLNQAGHGQHLKRTVAQRDEEGNEPSSEDQERNDSLEPEKKRPRINSNGGN